MAWIVRMPKLGQTMTTGTVQRWLKRPGESVREGEVVVVVESEKFTEEVEAREAGILQTILVQEGGEVAPGTPIAVVAAPGQEIAVPEETTDPAEPARRDRTRASPGARKLAREKGLDLSQSKGTGPQGAVTREDVLRQLAGLQARPPTPAPTPAGARDLTVFRRSLAERLGRSYRQAVHVTLHKSIEVSRILELRRLMNRRSGADLSLIDFILVGVVQSLGEHPAFNATFVGGRQQLFREKNVGLAVDTERGLVTPVLRRLEEKSVFEIARLRREATERARSGRHTPDDLSGGTFTVTNLGPLGIDAFTPIINPPEIAVLGVGRVEQRALSSGEGTFELRPCITFSLSFDHRVVDGADAARFLQALEKALAAASAAELGGG